MSRCYHCNKKGIEGEDLKQVYGIVIERESGSSKKRLFIQGVFWVDPNKQHVPFGLCKKCMKIVFEEAARALEEISEDEFRSL